MSGDLTAVAPVAGNSQTALVASPDEAAAINLLPYEIPLPEGTVTTDLSRLNGIA